MYMDIRTVQNYIRNTKNDWNYILPSDFYNNVFMKKNKYVLIDLRRPDDYKKFHIRGAKNIFWLNLFDDNNIKKLPKNKIIYLICYVGHTSSQAMTLLKLMGYTVIAIKYGYGVSPVSGVPVAGWIDYQFPVVRMSNSINKN